MRIEDVFAATAADLRSRALANTVYGDGHRAGGFEQAAAAMDSLAFAASRYAALGYDTTIQPGAGIESS